MAGMRSCIVLIALLAGNTTLAELPDGYWSATRAQEILDVTLRVRLDPDLSHLSTAERQALPELIAAGHILNDLYEQQLHAGALQARSALSELDDPGAELLRDLYYMSKGPIVSTLENVREPFLPVELPAPGGNVYPAGLQRDELDAFLASHPEAGDILFDRSVVRRASADNIAADLEQLDEHPAVEAMHRGLRERLLGLDADAANLYAIPYALAYAPQLARVRNHLEAAADILQTDTPDFADYLRLRSRDLLSSDYEAGDAAWVSGSFKNLNAQLGSYETYNDGLMGVKAFYAASIVVRDADKSRALEQAVAGLQDIENALPYESRRTVRSNIPVGAYNIVADFGQARGANTATILPNDADHTRKYGRTILVRNNILTNPQIFANKKQGFDAVMAPGHRGDMTMEGGFERTLWHEIGHYLGVARTADGLNLDEALGARADLLEELKSDLVSLFAARKLFESGYHDGSSLRAHYADGIRRTLQSVRPRPEQPYQNMQLMQFNYFMEYGLIELDPGSGLLVIHYDRYDSAVTDMLALVLQQQRSGDEELAGEFVERWNYWDELLHGRLAALIRENAGYQRTLVRYSALQN
jgi:hypothetical protein